MLKFVDEYRDVNLCLAAAERIRAISKSKMNIMEVCGGHAMAIRKNGIHKLVGENINLISGPGCPVCVASQEDIDVSIALCEIESAAICSFGDLFDVPGTHSSLAKKKSDGADVRIVYSVYDVLEFARREKDKKFIFISIGFETTAPCAAAAVMEAEREGLDNFYILGLNKTMPCALNAILEGSNIDALICPGHVTAITGVDIYKFIVEKIGISCCISGFEPLDILTSIYVIVELFEKGETALVNAYRRVVNDEGNEKARAIMWEVFEECDASWRGLGVIGNSGLRLREKYRRFDACENFKMNFTPCTKARGDFASGVASAKNDGCICGEILMGLKSPPDCRLFGKICTPAEPKGACMVSSEGSCAAWYKYGD